MSPGRSEAKRTIPSFFRRAVEDVPDKPWLFAEGVEYTYAGALERIERAAAALRSLGVGTRDRVLVTARNTADYLLSWFALMELGAV
ncbi:MAG: AMP-binding protein, partial [Actinomycetota bacterium]|nr:AMP-binding protein [Actinomycetota bacterium]